MKRLLVFVALCFATTMLYASPFLTCDATTEDVSHYVVEVDGVELAPIEVVTVAEGQTIMLDMNTYADGPHSFRVKFVNDLWSTESAWSSPFGIDPPTVLSQPQGLMLEK